MAPGSTKQRSSGLYSPDKRFKDASLTSEPPKPASNPGRTSAIKNELPSTGASQPLMPAPSSLGFTLSNYCGGVLAPERFRRLTGVKPQVSSDMLIVLRDAEKRKKRAGRASKLSLEDELLLALSYRGRARYSLTQGVAHPQRNLPQPSQALLATLQPHRRARQCQP